ncbi:hypothetical protein M8818_003138 [Zalaria obscura]|uniref:Uncharacterized protein n=1 Tax=Zalaria obscura TaxID=2024903 RepID=A0ACC3SFS5_9PEZI
MRTEAIHSIIRSCCRGGVDQEAACESLDLELGLWLCACITLRTQPSYRCQGFSTVVLRSRRFTSRVSRSPDARADAKTNVLQPASHIRTPSDSRKDVVAKWGDELSLGWTSTCYHWPEDCTGSPCARCLLASRCTHHRYMTSEHRLAYGSIRHVPHPGSRLILSLHRIDFFLSLSSRTLASSQARLLNLPWPHDVFRDEPSRWR